MWIVRPGCSPAARVARESDRGPRRIQWVSARPESLMRRFALPLALAAAVVVALAAAWFTLYGRGGGGERVTAEAPPVGAFNRVAVGGFAELVLVQGDRESVSIEASPRAAARVRVRSADGQLSIEAVENRPWWSFLARGGSRPPRITVHFRDLEALELAGAVKVSAASIETPALAIDATGAASVKVDALRAKSLRFSAAGAVKGEFAGALDEQSVSIAGAGEYRAPGLLSQTAKIAVSGAGRAVVSVAKSLDAAISGAGSIEYIGDPVVRDRISGAGRITRRSGGTGGARAEAPRQCTVTGKDGGSVSGLNSSGPPVSGSRSACTPETARMSATRQSRSRSTSIAATSATRSQG